MPRLAAGILPYGVRTVLASYDVRMRMDDCAKRLLGSDGEGKANRWTNGSVKGLFVVFLGLARKNWPGILP